MEHYKISKLLNNSTVSMFVTRKWVQVNDLSRGQYSAKKNIRFKTVTLRSDLRDYGDVYIVVKGRIHFEGTVDSKKRNKMLVFKNNSLFRPCISKLNNTFIENAKDLYIVVSMYKSIIIP